MIRRLKSLKDVIEWGFCIGCGACAYACSKQKVTLVNIHDSGIRPRFEKRSCGGCVECLSFCPGYRLENRNGSAAKGRPADLLIGPALEIWEGYATDEEIRLAGSSGGVLSALSLYCLEKEGMNFVLHTGPDPETPWLNKTVKSFSRQDLIQRAGSRYSPSSPCEALALIEESEKPCVFIGKPCDAAAVSMIRRQRPGLDQNLGLVLAFFCAGPPGTQATLNLLRDLKVEAREVESLRYRGMGWPGSFRVSLGNGKGEKALSYEDSWGRLAKHPRSFRCHLCPDGLGELADISCGDAWHRYKGDKNPGISLVLARTERGREILCRAREAGYVCLEPSGTEQVIRAQGMVERRKDILGRIQTLRIFLIPAPHFSGFHLKEAWQEKPLKARARTILGTMKRIWRRDMWRRHPFSWHEASLPSAVPRKKVKIPSVPVIVRRADRLKVWIYRLTGHQPPAAWVVLYYHGVTEGELPRFCWQMDELLRLAEPRSLQKKDALEPGRRYAAVTFDDGLAHTTKRVLPELVGRNIPVTLFVPSGCLGENPPWIPAPKNPDDGERVMTADELRRIAMTNLVSIGSHCLSHGKLPLMEEETAKAEILRSKTDLETLLGKKVDYLSFPHGSYDERHVRWSMEAGYAGVFGIVPAYAFQKDEYVNGRVRVDPGDWQVEFRLKLIGAYRWLAWAFRIKRRLKAGWAHGRMKPRNTDPSPVPVENRSGIGTK